jgi:hypothetical protein
MDALLDMLRGGDRRSIGRVDEVVAAALEDRRLFPVLFKGMLHDEALIRMRAADAVEKISLQHPEWLRPYKEQLIQQVSRIEQQEVRWHVAQLLPRLELDEEERAACVVILQSYLQDKSKIVKTFAMQAMADLAEQEPELRSQVIPLLKEATRRGSSAMKSRGRKLLDRLA